MTSLRRRALLRALAAGPVAAALAGCNLNGGDSGTPDSDAPDGTRSPTGAPPGSPGPTAPSTDPTAEPSPTAVATTAVTPSPTPERSASPSPAEVSSPTTSPASTVTPTPAPLSERARTVVARLDAGEFDAVHDSFTDDLAREVPVGQLQRYWLGLTAQHGAFGRVTDVSESTRDGTETAVATVACAEGDAPVELAFDGGDASGLWFPAEYSSPDYADSSAFTERDVTVAAAGCPLPGTLTMPDGGDSDGDGAGGAADGAGGADDENGDSEAVPGVVLVHGSGRADRNQTVGSNEIFRDLAWGLATRGIAVLRYDKRTFECDVPLADWAIDRIVVDDALRALETLRGVDGVDPDSLAVVGHSLGGTCTPRIVERDGDVAAAAMLAANARPITAVSLDQVEHYFRIDGDYTATERERARQIQQAFEEIESGEVPDSRVVEGYPAAWWSSLLDYDQVATARSVSLPLWLAQGGRDFQVLADESFALWQSELGERSATTFESYPGLSHLFQPGAEPSLREEYVFHDNVAREVVDDLAGWVVEAVG